ITHFASRNAMNIENLGENIISLFIENKLISGVADLYYLKKEDISKLKKNDTKFSSNIIRSIENSKQSGLARLIYALGIRNIGEKAGVLLAERFSDIYSLMSADEQTLCGIEEIGPESAQAIIRFFSSAHTKKLIERLVEAGVSVKSIYSRKSSLLEGKTIVITGTLPSLKRDEAEQLIRQHGGNPSGSVSKKTSLLLCGADAGSKLDKARSLGIPIISEEEFMNIILEK
ncbi:MAG TPA: DNA ligase (NAD(+)) LigA, partial [Clostridiales bacterium]|nr:DNA ligase (NAD(+)) LigA [Clostridiales bacterium]